MEQERNSRPRRRQESSSGPQQWQPIGSRGPRKPARKQEPRGQQQENKQPEQPARQQESRGLRPPKKQPRQPAVKQQQAQTAVREPERPAKQETYTAPCCICGGEAVLRYKPTGLLPIYCKTCFNVKMNEKENPGTRESIIRRQEKRELDLFEPAPAPVREATPVEPDRVSSTFGEFKLDERLERAIAEAGYETPTPVQLRTIPIALTGRDLIGTAQTGTGKTAAFALPILQHLLTNQSARPCTRVLVLTPTRELAEQVNDSFAMLGKYTGIRTDTVYGGVGMEPQERALRTGVEVIVACPGRLLDHMERGNTDLTTVETLVLDEADRMLDMGFLPQIKRILAQLPKTRQTMLFSATFAPELTELAAQNMHDAQRVDVDLQAPPNTISHAMYPCPQHLKTKLVLKLLCDTDTDSVLVFTRTKHRANRVAKQISAAGYEACVLHSNKSQNQRQVALDDFREGRRQILVATDIAARGLDVETISHVINYDIPDTADTYIHRIGRTGRAERDGDAMTLITKEDAAIVFDIEKALGEQIERRTLDDFDYTAPAPARDEFKRDPLPPRKPKPAVQPRVVVEEKPESDAPSAEGTVAKRRRRYRGPRRPRPEQPSNN